MKILKILCIVVGVLAGVSLAGLLALQQMYPSITFHYRLTVTVDTPEGVRSGRSVVEVTESRRPKIAESVGSVMHSRGEATVVDLGPRGVLFALLRGKHDGSQPGDLVYDAFPPPTLHGSGAALPENLRRYAQSSEKSDLRPDLMPLLVRFRALDDPKSVERVDPTDLAASFGSGVHLRSATLELTRDPVTTGIERWLPWLSKLNGRSLSNQSSSGILLYERLHGGDFIRTGV